MDTQFNQPESQLNILIPMLIKKSRNLYLGIEQNEKLSSSCISFLTQGNYRGHTLRLVPLTSYQLEQNQNHLIEYFLNMGHTLGLIPRTFYQLEQNKNHLVEYDQLELVPFIQNHSREELISTTMTWLNWMPHLRLLNIDTQMLLKLVPTINHSGTINRFSSLEELIVRQLDIPLDEDTLSVIVQLNTSSSLRDIRIIEYKELDSQSIYNNKFVSNICQICCNMNKLETMTIRFKNPHSLFESTVIEELAGVEKKNCRSECIYVSDDTIQFWLEK
ncbi:unnamed protein product [Adineta steineri]|uniref:Uncharacterized protein n=1 Tax=Adineta steineri TaxID=433720 RepID=A0A814M3F9_9BILA|nr:unnamed protein product [Adineta steineri]CAF0780513.1 unnamed protein product [Adineta steineri]CAF1072178.1 unnamed protein product [Adineta steineri]